MTYEKMIYNQLFKRSQSKDESSFSGAVDQEQLSHD